jgi:nicotinamidase-related amidase
MSLSTLDQKTALIVIDLQNGIRAFPTVHPLAEIVKAASTLADAFRGHDLPVVLVTAVGMAPGRSERSLSSGNRQAPAGWADLVPELSPRPQDHLVKKSTWGAFTNTGLDEHLRGLGVTQVVIAGVSTSHGVESTARQAYELGFNVTLAVDAMTDMDHDSHSNSVTRIFPDLGETGTTEEVLSLLGS